MNEEKLDVSRPFRVEREDPAAPDIVAAALDIFCRGREHDVVLLCIGTDRTIADALGPLVGSLVREQCPELPIIGTLDEPLHAENLKQQVMWSRLHHPGRLEIAIDASLSRPQEVDWIDIRPEGLIPGRVLAKSLPKVGEISILAKVGPYPGRGNGADPLPAARLGPIYQMAKAIARGIEQWWTERSQ
ncbi:MAG: spore protease YyaC [Solirubrobacterales bacterium]